MSLKVNASYISKTQDEEEQEGHVSMKESI
jgi:hypothetical protein